MSRITISIAAFVFLSNLAIGQKPLTGNIRNWIAKIRLTGASQKQEQVFILTANGVLQIVGEKGNLIPFNKINNVKAIISANNQTIIALKNDGTVWAWGNNEEGILGNSKKYEKRGRSFSFQDSDVPLRVGNLSGVKAISSLYNTGYALLNDGTVWAWGNSREGLTGNGKEVIPAMITEDGANVPEPQQVIGVSNAIGIAGPMALLADGTVMAWGQNSRGELGNGNTNPSSVAKKVCGLTNVMAISATQEFRMALCSDGSVWTWGSNMHGRLGIAKEDEGFGENKMKYSSIPVRVKDIDNAVAIFCGWTTDLVLLKNGNVKGWGDGRRSALGGGKMINAPVLIPNIKNAIAIYGAIYSGFALLANGDVMVWGDHGSETDFRTQKITNISNMILK